MTHCDSYMTIIYLDYESIPANHLKTNLIHCSSLFCRLATKILLRHFYFLSHLGLRTYWVSLDFLQMKQMMVRPREVSRLLFEPFPVAVPQRFRSRNSNIYRRENVTVKKAAWTTSSKLVGCPAFKSCRKRLLNLFFNGPEPDNSQLTAKWFTCYMMGFFTIMLNLIWVICCRYLEWMLVDWLES